MTNLDGKTEPYFTKDVAESRIAELVTDAYKDAYRKATLERNRHEVQTKNIQSILF